MKVDIFLYGHLIDKVGKEKVTVEADTAREAIMKLSHEYPKLKAPLQVGRYRIAIDNIDTAEQLNSHLYEKELHLRPVERFSGGDIGNIIVGAVLIVVGAVMVYFGVPGGEHLIQAGIAMMVTGVIQLFFPTPSLEGDSSATDGSKYVGSPGNTTAVGTRIGLGYGLYKVSGHYISFDVNATDVVAV